MAKLDDILAYLLHRLNQPEGVPVSRLARMLYLADWRSAITGDAPLSSVRWVYGPYGPMSDEVSSAARNNPRRFLLTDATDERGTRRLVIPSPSEESTSVSDTDRAVLDFVVQRTRQLTSDQLFRLVFSTYPVLKAAEPAGTLDLEALAKEYREEVSLPEPEEEGPAVMTK